MNCPYCGADNREKAKFCRLCAKRIDGQTGPCNATEKATEKVSNTTENKFSSKKIAYFAIPIILVIAVGSWLFANHSSSNISESKVDKAASTATPSPVVSTTPSVPTITQTESNSATPVIAESPVNPTPDPQASTNSSAVINPAIARSPSAEEKPAAPVDTVGTKTITSNETTNASDQKPEKKVVKSTPKKEVKKVQLNAKPQLKPDAASSGSATKVVQPPSQYQEPKASQKSSFASDIDACKTKSLFAKSSCENQVRAKYCVGKWGSSPECPAQQWTDPSDGRG